MYHIFFIQSSIHGHLDCLHVLARLILYTLFSYVAQYDFIKLKKCILVYLIYFLMLLLLIMIIMILDYYY